MLSALWADRSATLSASSCETGGSSPAEAEMLPLKARCSPFAGTEGAVSSRTCPTEVDAVEPLSCPNAEDVMAMCPAWTLDTSDCARVAACLISRPNADGS